jgi:hypothetical protein
MNRKTMARRAMVHARATGCTCCPEIEIYSDDHDQRVVVLVHDDRCRRLRQLRELYGVERLPFPVVSGWSE